LHDAKEKLERLESLLPLRIRRKFLNVWNALKN